MPPLTVTAEPDPHRLRRSAWPGWLAALVLAALAGALIVALPGADAQTAPQVQLTQFPGNAVTYTRAGETHTMVTFCPAAMFAVSGGWSYQSPNRVPLAGVEVEESYASQLPGGGGQGAWTLTIRKTSVGTALVFPYVTCLGGPGVAQLPE